MVPVAFVPHRSAVSAIHWRGPANPSVTATSLVHNRSRIIRILSNCLIKLGILKDDFDYHLVRASMVFILLFFGYQKWFQYEAQALIPYISHGPLIFWLYPAFGVRGASWFLGASEWSFALLLFLGFCYKRLGILGALGSSAAFMGTATIIPFMPDGWAASAGGFPAMAGNVPFLLEDVVLLGVFLYLLEEELA